MKVLLIITVSIYLRGGVQDMNLPMGTLDPDGFVQFSFVFVFWVLPQVHDFSSFYIGAFVLKGGSILVRVLSTE